MFDPSLVQNNFIFEYGGSIFITFASICIIKEIKRKQFLTNVKK